MDPRDQETLSRLETYLQRPFRSELLGFLLGGDDPKAVATVFVDEGEFSFYTEEGKQAVHQLLRARGLSSLLTDRMMGST
jgi:hypothetical protein